MPDRGFGLIASRHGHQRVTCCGNEQFSHESARIRGRRTCCLPTGIRCCSRGLTSPANSRQVATDDHCARRHRGAHHAVHIGPRAETPRACNLAPGSTGKTGCFSRPSLQTASNSRWPHIRFQCCVERHSLFRCHPCTAPSVRTSIQAAQAAQNVLYRRRHCRWVSELRVGSVPDCSICHTELPTMLI